MSVFADMADELKRAGRLGAAKIYEDFENGVGTYLKVVRFSEPTNPDGLIVLYLRSNGTFLLLGYWQGYERSVVAGRWSKQGDAIHVDGLGQTSTDAPPDVSGRYEREFEVKVENHTPALFASTTRPVGVSWAGRDPSSMSGRRRLSTRMGSGFRSHRMKSTSGSAES